MLTDFAKDLVETGGYGGAMTLIFALVIGHGLADYPLQGAFLASSKNRYGDPSVFFGGSGVPKGLWVHALTAHSMIHAGGVWLVTGSCFLGLLEFVLHWITDFVRCENWIGFTTDQMIHVGCKVLFVVLLYAGVEMPF
jgi:hypothetical protein